MKTILLALALILTGLALRAQIPPPNRLPRLPQTAPAAPVAAPAEEMIPPGMIDFQSADVNQVLEIYSKLVGRTLLRPATLPGGPIVLKTLTSLTKSEAIQALEAVLAINGIVVVPIGDKFVKVLPSDQAAQSGGEVDTNSAADLPNLGTYETHIVQLKNVKPSVVIPLIQGFGKLPGNLFAIDDNGILVMRDYAENIKRMLEMIDRIDVSVPAEYISEVIPIRYAMASDIASALNSLGGSGGSTVSFGSSGSPTPVNGVHTGGFGGMNSSGGGQIGGATPYGGQSSPIGGVSTPNGTPSGGTTFQQRLAAIVARANGAPAPTGGGGTGQDKIQLFGQTKIIADSRSNSLLVFATREDMENIKHVISELDVLLPQVLIESIIMDVTIGSALTAGVSAQQNPTRFGHSNVSGGGSAINGPTSFLGTIANQLTNGTSSTTLAGLTNVTGGLSYFGNIGPTWDLAVQAAQSDNNAHVIQRPRIQTSQAKPAQFFVGQTVPYVTGSTYGSAYGNSSSYSQLSVGVELDVTPFINPDGLVVMDISQEIDEISGSTAITGVGNIPNTVKRTLNSEMAVKNRDTVIMGGFVEADKSHTVSGVPLLMDVPLLGWLFRSTADSKTRSELLVMIRPTVLKTPTIAADETIREGRRLPGVSAAAAEDAADQRKLINAERKKELKNARKDGSSDGFFNMKMEENADPNVPAADPGPAPQSSDDNTPPATTPATVTSPDNLPAASPADQDKARAALDQKMNELDAQPAAAPAQPPQ
jgi:general secretion pathway protein D